MWYFVLPQCTNLLICTKGLHASAYANFKSFNILTRVTHLPVAFYRENETFVVLFFSLTIHEISQSGRSNNRLFRRTWNVVISHFPSRLECRYRALVASRHLRDNPLPVATSSDIECVDRSFIIFCRNSSSTHEMQQFNRLRSVFWKIVFLFRTEVPLIWRWFICHIFFRIWSGFFFLSYLILFLFFFIDFMYFCNDDFLSVYVQSL